jgi:hypothetical protein
MAHEFAVNLDATTSQWLGVYHLILRMLKAGYWLRASSDGSAKVVSDDITAHSSLVPMSNVGTGGGATVGTVWDHPYGKLVALGGMSGLVTPVVSGGKSEGNYVTLSGAAQAALNGTHQIYQVDNATACKILVRTAGALGADANTGSITWTEKNFVDSASYGTRDTARWWALLEGPETYQINFTAETTGSFLRGERVVQAVSGAEGDLLGVVWDPVSSNGWAVIMPRIGKFNASDTVTGQFSNASFTATAVHKFRRQWVFTKGTITDGTNGSAWYCVFRDGSAAEVAEAYHTKAASAGCNATVAPGGGGTGNYQFNSAVAASRYVLRCNNNSTTPAGGSLTHADGIIYPASSGPNGRIQAAAANVMPRADRSADGTWWVAHYTAVSSGFHLLGCFRVDGGEDGEVEILQHHTDTSASFSADARSGSFSGTRFGSSQFLNTESRYYWQTILRRSFGAAGGGPFYEPNTNFGYVSTPVVIATSTSSPVGATWGGLTRRMWAHPATTPPAFKIPLGVRDGLGGNLRWAYLIQQGSNLNTAESRQYIVIAAYSANIPGFMIGPWDGTTDPLAG